MPRRYYTPELATSSLPLVAKITQDLQGVAVELREAWSQARAEPVKGEHREDLVRVKNLQERFSDHVAELDTLGIELKDPFSGLIDFRARRGPDEVYLCWQLGEPQVGHWHEIEAGFRGRQPIESF